METFKGKRKLRVREVKPQIELSQSRSNLVIARPSTLPVNQLSEHALGLVKPGARSFIHYLIGCWEPGTLQQGPDLCCLVLRRGLSVHPWLCVSKCHKQCFHSVLLIV